MHGPIYDKFTGLSDQRTNLLLAHFLYLIFEGFFKKCSFLYYSQINLLVYDFEQL